jgi:tetratricopeptide (TPR) repeat protein
MIASLLHEPFLVASEGAAYLKIPQGAASTALGSAMVGMHGVESLWYTPAGLAGQDSLQVALSRNAWLGQTRNDYLAGALPLGPGGLGAWVNYVGTEDAYRDTQGIDQGSFGVYNLSGGLGYGWKLGAVALGLSGKYFQERVELLQSANWAVDLGTQIDLGTPRARLGLAVQNLGPRMDYDTSLGEVRAPLTYRIGFALERIAGFFTLLQELRMLPESGETSYLAGAEFQGRAGQVALAGRAGYDTSAQVLGGGLAGFTLGAGAVLGQLHVDIALVPYGPLGNPYRMSVGWEFGSPARPAQAAARPTARPQVQPAAGAVITSANAAKLPSFGSAKEAWAAAKAAEASGSLEQARRDYIAATEVEPSHYETWGRLGKFEYAQDRKAAAVAAFEQMLALKPDKDFGKWLEAYKAEP